MGRGDDRRGGRDPEKGWQRDDKGRLYREEAGSRAYKHIEDRDSALEEPYAWRPCEHSCCPSILGSVAAHQDVLLAEYMRWCCDRQARESHDSDTLAQWERERFSARLERAAHCILLFAIRIARFGEPRTRARQPRLKDGLTDEQRLAQMQLALHKLAEGKAMPGRITGREWDERRRAAIAKGESQSTD